MADIAIVALIVLGAFIGARKGFVVPLVTTGGALVAASAVYAGPLTGAMPAGTVGLGAGAIAMGMAATLFARVGYAAISLVQRFAILRKADRVLGIPLGAASALVALYVALVASSVLDGWLDPLHGKDKVGAQDLAAIQTLAAANPTLAMFADPETLELLAQSASQGALPVEQVADANAALGFYERTIRPAVKESRIAPVLLALGERIPIVGRPTAHAPE